VTNWKKPILKRWPPRGAAILFHTVRVVGTISAAIRSACHGQAVAYRCASPERPLHVAQSTRFSDASAARRGGLVGGHDGHSNHPLNVLSRLQINGPLFRQIVQGKVVVADVLPPPEYLIESYLVVLQLTDDTQ